MANKEFGNTLRQLREKKGYTQKQAAELLGLKNKSTLGSWEVGKSEPDACKLVRLLKIYEVKNIYEAFGEIVPMPLDDDMETEIKDKYHQLNSKYRELVNILITQLWEIQEEYTNGPQPVTD